MQPNKHHSPFAALMERRPSVMATDHDDKKRNKPANWLAPKTFHVYAKAIKKE